MGDSHDLEAVEVGALVLECLLCLFVRRHRGWSCPRCRGSSFSLLRARRSVRATLFVPDGFLVEVHSNTTETQWSAVTKLCSESDSVHEPYAETLYLEVVVTFVSQPCGLLGSTHNTRSAQGAPAPRCGVGGEERAAAALRLFPPPTTPLYRRAPRRSPSFARSPLLSPGPAIPLPRTLYSPAPSVRTTRCLASPRPAVHHADFREDPHW